MNRGGLSVTNEIVQDARRSIPAQSTGVMQALRIALGSDNAFHPADVRAATSASAMPARFKEDEPDDMLLDPNDEDSAIPSRALLAKAQQEYDVKEEDLPIEDPLNILADEEEADLIMEVAPEELEAEDDLLEEEVMPFHFANFTLPKPKPLSEDTRRQHMINAIERIYSGGQHVGQNYTLDSQAFRGADNEESSLPAGPAVTTKDVYVLLLARLSSRGLKKASGTMEGDHKDGEDRIRQSICDFVLADFTNR